MLPDRRVSTRASSRISISPKSRPCWCSPHAGAGFAAASPARVFRVPLRHRVGTQNGPSTEGSDAGGVFHRMPWAGGHWHPVTYQVAPAAFVPERLPEHGGMAGIAFAGRPSGKPKAGPRGRWSSFAKALGGRCRGHLYGKPSAFPLSATLGLLGFSLMVCLTIESTEANMKRVAAPRAATSGPGLMQC